jgi:cell wall-associated NlpC family hydrolase
MSSVGRPELVSLAKSYVGTPYRWGGRSSAGLDCSGLVYVVLKRAGVTSTYRTSSALREWTTPVSRSQALPGDLVFGPGHVGIYAGDGMMLDAPDFGLKVDLRGVYKTMTSYGRIPT